ncbi:hypothetical protein JCM39068_41920 [Desulfocastanea catecholica]
MCLTDAGSKIHEKVQPIFEQLENIEAFILNIGKVKEGVLKIGCSETASFYVVPSLIKPFISIYPGIKLVVDRGPSCDMIESLLNNKNELVITQYFPNDKRVKMRYMGKKEIILVAAKESLLLPEDSVTVKTLNEIPLIVPLKGSGSRDIVINRLKEIGVTPKVAMESSSIPFIKHFICGDEGVSFLCRDVVLNELSNGLLKEVHILDFTPVIEYGVAYLKRSNLSQAALAFLKMIDQFIKQEQF